MLAIRILVLYALTVRIRSNESEEPVLYYYGLEENERSLPPCEERQACSAVLPRYWRGAALARLCRCGRRQRCDTRAEPDWLLELNNRDHLQFCQPTTNWAQCAPDEQPLTVITSYDRINPDDLERQHHQGIELTPPKITLKCKCESPNYWRLFATEGDTRIYRCSSLPLCRTEEFCGNVSFDMMALYQSCLCPKHHMCVHRGGVAREEISEVLYRGRGWKAYCQHIDADNDDSYEDY